MALQKMRWLMAALLCLVIWPGIAHGQSSELLEANSNYQSLYQQIRYSEAEAAPFGPAILVTHSQYRKFEKLEIDIFRCLLSLLIDTR